MENKTIEIEFRKEQVVIWGLCLIFVALIPLSLLIFIKHIDSAAQFGYTACVMLSGFSGFMCIKRALGSKIGLTIDDQGIINASNHFSAGRILWENIIDMRANNFVFNWRICHEITLVVIDPSSGKSGKISISAFNLIYDRDELLKLLQERLDQYRNGA